MTRFRENNSDFNYTERQSSINQNIIRKPVIPENKWMLWACWLFIAALPTTVTAIISYNLFF